MSDKEAQADEVLALASIYEPTVFSVNEDSDIYSGEFKAFPQLPQPFFVVKNLNGDEKGLHQIEYLPPITLHFELPSTYPSMSSPTFTLSCKWLNRKQMSELCEKLDKLWIENEGEVVLFQWFTFLNEESLNALSIGGSLNLSEAVLKTKFKRQISIDEKEIKNKLKDGNNLLIIKNGGEESAQDTETRNVVNSSELQDKNSSCVSSCSKMNPMKGVVRKSKPLCQNSSINDQRKNHWKKTRRSNSFPGRNWPKSNSVEWHRNCSEQESSRSSGEIDSEENGRYDERAVQETVSETQLLTVILEYNKIRQHQVFDLSFFTCNICFEEKLGSQCKAFKPCNHAFCKSCLKSYFEIQISSGSVSRLNCPEEKCSSQALPPMVRDLVEPELYQKYDSLLLTTTLDTMSDIIYCPRQSCHCPVLVEPECNMASCPSCFLVFCVYCKMTYHGVVPCKLRPDERRKIVEDYVNSDREGKKQLEQRYGRQQIQQLVDNVLSENWIRNYSKSCPNCHSRIEKLDGCNKMTCWRCDTYFCWLCMAPLTKGNPYLHYNDSKSSCNGKLFQGINEIDMEDNEDENEWEMGQFLEQ